MQGYVETGDWQVAEKEDGWTPFQARNLGEEETSAFERLKWIIYIMT